ncbi:p25-alpha-domain-containing protein [Chytridium lagenaria]|nr:p25-alpha-domain-containing protein [Chytridium lagenaria]
MATLEDLHDVFERFAAFGSNRNLSSLDSSLLSISGGGLTLDGPRFAKFARDTGLVDGKKVTATDIDIIFNKTKSKGNRRIDWPVFLEAVQLIAEKRYPEKSDQQALHCTLYDVCIRSPGGPAKKGTTVQADAVLDRLTDTTAYTGTHKSRFDENGNGRGLAGRDTGSKTDRLDKLVSRNDSTTPTIPPISARLEIIATTPKKPTNRSIHGSSTSIASVGKSTGSSVFDRLTNSNGYTGTHKLRFNASGTGRGLAGRDSIPKNGVGVYRGGDVKELSQILRPGF